MTVDQKIAECKEKGETDYEIAQLLVIEYDMTAVKAMTAVGLIDGNRSIIKKNLNHEL